MNIVLAPDGPLHAGATLARYHLWGEDPANRLADGALLRVLRRHGRLVPYEVRPTGSVDDARLVVRIARARDAATGEAVAAEVRQIFGLAFDLSGFYRMAKGDPVLAALVEPLYGMRPTSRSEEHTSELQSLRHLVCRLLLEKKKKDNTQNVTTTTPTTPPTCTTR